MNSNFFLPVTSRKPQGAGGREQGASSNVLNPNVLNPKI